MKMSTRDRVMKKLLDAEESVRDYEMFSRQVDDNEIAGIFKQFAEECGMQARKLQTVMDKYDQYGH